MQVGIHDMKCKKNSKKTPGLGFFPSSSYTLSHVVVVSSLTYSSLYSYLNHLLEAQGSDLPLFSRERVSIIHVSIIHE